MQLQIEATQNLNRGDQRIESKDHMWKPAPIVGRDFVQREVEVNIPVSQQLRNAQN